MSKFEWHTEDDWRDELEEKSAENAPPPRWRLPVALIALLALVGVVVFTQLRKTVNEATAQVETDVRATFALLHDSAENSDIELFSTYLSGRDRNWTTGYQQLVALGNLSQRDALRLALVSERPEVADVVLGADLRSAVLTATTSYAIPVGNGLSQTVTLQQPYTFRQGETRWLFAPPETDFWGERQYGTNTIFLYEYPARDEKIVQRLMRDFDEAYGHLCRREPANLHCRQEWYIRFDEMPLALTGASISPSDRQFRTIVVPTPSLVGLPTNTDSYRALLSGYAHLILTAQLTERTGYVCCRAEPLFQALIDQISAELGLRANIDAPENFRLAQQYLSPDNWPFDWDSTFEDADVSLKVSYTAVTFLRQQYPSVSAYKMLALLPRFSDRATWIQQVVALIDSTANNSDPSMLLESNFTAYQNWLGKRLDSYATVVER